jgi:hypothetical protein
MRRTVIMVGMASVAAVVVTALSSLGSDRWLAASYPSLMPASTAHTRVAGTSAVGDEAYWLNAGTAARLVTPAAQPLASVAASRAFIPGAHMTITGHELLDLEIISTAAVPAASGLLDPRGRPLLLVTAKERDGVRIVRFLIEADPAGDAKAGNHSVRSSL